MPHPSEKLFFSLRCGRVCEKNLLGVWAMNMISRDFRGWGLMNFVRKAPVVYQNH